MREGNGTIRITKEEGVIAEDSKNSIAIPVYDLYECGLDSDCVDNTCQLMGSEYVQCRCCNWLHTYQRWIKLGLILVLENVFQFSNF